ncbi:BnaA08g15780D [Brassica napus]|uniref:BnaA08g15780D protein n=1 Tax=Brassica napus TaxID=3708 RepID=A0A078I4J9_BRANA|nr:BnaA08g15780D [Brassica napus]
MRDAIDEMNGKELNGRTITVNTVAVEVAIVDLWINMGFARDKIWVIDDNLTLRVLKIIIS